MDNHWLIWRKALVIVAIVTLPAYLAIAWGLSKQNQNTVSSIDIADQADSTNSQR